MFLLVIVNCHCRSPTQTVADKKKSCRARSPEFLCPRPCRPQRGIVRRPEVVITFHHKFLLKITANSTPTHFSFIEGYCTIRPEFISIVFTGSKEEERLRNLRIKLINLRSAF